MRLPTVLALIPWSLFWQNSGPGVADLQKLTVSLSGNQKTCTPALKSFTAVVARTDATRARGLSGRPAPLGPNEAMLFVFDPPQAVAFWMKDTLIPLQIGFFDPTGVLAGTQNMSVEKKPAEPFASYRSPGTVQAVLEVAPRSLAGIRVGRSLLCVRASQN